MGNDVFQCVELPRVEERRKHWDGEWAVRMELELDGVALRTRRNGILGFS